MWVERVSPLVGAVLLVGSRLLFVCEVSHRIICRRNRGTTCFAGVQAVSSVGRGVQTPVCGSRLGFLMRVTADFAATPACSDFVVCCARFGHDDLRLYV